MKGHNRVFLPSDLTFVGVFLIGCTVVYAGHRLRTWGRP